MGICPTKGVQLTNLNVRESPCPCCGSGFKTHQCVVWSQIAVLLVNGAHLITLNEPVAFEETRHRCEICLMTLPDVAQLAQHLQQAHALQGLAFNEGRDAIDGHPACAHCGIPFQSMAGLKTHIVQGKCMEFNPDDKCVARATSGQQILPFISNHVTRGCGNCHSGSLQFWWMFTTQMDSVFAIPKPVRRGYNMYAYLFDNWL